MTRTCRGAPRSCYGQESARSPTTAEKRSTRCKSHLKKRKDLHSVSEEFARRKTRNDSQSLARKKGRQPVLTMKILRTLKKAVRSNKLTGEGRRAKSVQKRTRQGGGGD